MNPNENRHLSVMNVVFHNNGSQLGSAMSSYLQYMKVGVCSSDLSFKAVSGKVSLKCGKVLEFNELSAAHAAQASKMAEQAFEHLEHAIKCSSFGIRHGARLERIVATYAIQNDSLVLATVFMAMTTSDNKNISEKMLLEMVERHSQRKEAA